MIWSKCFGFWKEFPSLFVLFLSFSVHVVLVNLFIFFEKLRLSSDYIFSILMHHFRKVIASRISTKQGCIFATGPVCDWILTVWFIPNCFQESNCTRNQERKKKSNVQISRIVHNMHLTEIGYYTVARRYEFYLWEVKIIRSKWVKYRFVTSSSVTKLVSFLVYDWGSLYPLLFNKKKIVF